MRIRAWMAVGALLCAVHYFLGPESPLNPVLYCVVGFLSVGVTLVALRRNRPGNVLAWRLFAAGQLTWVVADVVYYSVDSESFPSWADAFYLSAYPALIGGLLMLSRPARGRDLAGLIDAAIVATGLGLVYWVYVISPIAMEAGTPWPTRAVAAGYPCMDMVLFAVTARLLTRTGRRTTSARLLIVGSGLVLLCDVFFSYLSAFSVFAGGLSDSCFLFAYVCWAAAALHPSCAQPPSEAREPDRFGRGRLVVLTAAVMLAPGVLFAEGILGSGSGNWVAIGIGAVTLFLLVLLRMSGFVRQVQSQSRRLEDQALRDELTGLANRRLFEQRVHEALSSGNPQVAVLDLTGFKGVNDRFGHSVGDVLLAAVAERLATRVRSHDLVARMGGDEFAVLVPDATPAEAEAILERLAGALRQPILAGDIELLISASFGLADAVGTDDPGEVLRRADVAMYAAKSDRVRSVRRYTPDLDEVATEQARMGAELRTALDTGQFSLAYQPIVELPQGRVVAVEALVRWMHPVHGCMSPVEFIPAAERSGLIVELGEWILRTACARAATWQRAADPEHVSVNVSARQLAEPGFAELVAAVLAETGLPAGRLVVEVTETAVFGGGRAVRAVEDVKALGVRVALDDFGTGHSSLGLLHTVGVDILKVDKSFVDNITLAGRHAVIATALIQVCAGLGLTAIAEGVETAEQAAELYRLGYRLAQGYHFGRPASFPGVARDEISVGGPR